MSLPSSVPTSPVVRADVLVVGAGPYGIAAAQELWHRGHEVVVVGDPFATWHHHTLDVMSLRSDPRASSVWSPDDRYSFPEFLGEARDTGGSEGDGGDQDVVPVALYRDYLRRVEERLPFRLVRGLVGSLDSEAAGGRGEGTFRALGKTLPEGYASRRFEIHAPTVVIATGLGGHRHVPEALRELPAERLVHSWDTERIDSVHGAKVLLVGGGQSAAESADSLTRRRQGEDPNRLTWAVKRRPLFFREPLRVPTPLFKLMLAGSHLLYRLPPPLLRALGRATFRTTITPRLKPVWQDPSIRKRITDAEGLGLETTGDGIHCRLDGETYDLVVSATGYRYSLRGLPFLSDRLVARVGPPERPPRVGADFSCSVPGLYLIGGIAEPTHGPAMRFVLGARHAARRLGESLEQAPASRHAA